MSKPRKWYRVELDDKNNIVALSVAAPAEAENVFYVQASSEDEAKKVAHRYIMKLLMRRKKTDRIAAGLCPTCGIEPYEGVDRCKKFCKPTENRLRRESSAKKHGREPKLDGLPPEAFMTHDEKVKLSTLETVLAFWKARPSAGRFEKWLEMNIQAIKTKNVKGKAA